MPDTMMRPAETHLPDGHPKVRIGKVGVLLVNLGTPDGTDYWSMRKYLSQFLSDKRVIEVPQPIWQLILQGPILTFRPFKSGAAYKKVWTEEGSPLLLYTKLQAEGLAARITDENIVVDYAMRYGNPSIESKMTALKDQGCDRILIFALYPQYAAPTTATVHDEAFRVLQKQRWQPALRTVPPFHDDPAYIEALANSLSEGLSKMDFEPERLILSYHGIPKSYFEKGDPYHCHCHKTTRLVKERMGLADDFVMTTFQSRFGPTEWLKPYTDETLESLPEEGIKKVAIAAPAFISDCLETIEEIGMEGKEEFLEAGGTHFAALECLNASDHAIGLIETLVKSELMGWVR